jgi:predicted enzyme related to lactoylglutathione lyase
LRDFYDSKKDVQPVTEAGKFSIILDPTGAALGLWEPKKA